MPAAQTARRNGPYVPLSAFYADDDAVIALESVGNDLAELLFLRSLAYCARDTRLDGFVSEAKLTAGRVITRPAAKLTKAAAALVDVGLWQSEQGGWRIRQWIKWNRSHSEVEASRAKDRRRKGGDSSPPPPDEPEPEEHELPPDSARNPNGHQPDAGRNPDGFQPSRARGRAAGATQRIAAADTTQSSGNSTPPAPARQHPVGATLAELATPPQPLEQLRQALAHVGIAHISWDLDGVGQRIIDDAISRVGIPAMVKHAQRRHQPNQPAFSARAFLAGWAGLQPPPALTVVPDEPARPCNCGNGYPDRRNCPDCRRNDTRSA